ncbi:hypothetical protein Desmer_3303 [Desulfosporosinus meridiei DSM 13257]|uniref:Uncharacterized protein n=1 Tax=Desulfosporosinus meridiei (strain ATCC BAA-275 / DSM 13257 / KCTC 12902 / NCIMB 13706 / S10) TaxID=768704 RepID=J7J1H6_DESMD|nr:hypothetical protein Desmer_3303 [Desulfosporosinus meridiei DSM 13257]
MSSEELHRLINLDTIETMFILATFILLTAIVQKLKPTFSLSYNKNSKPSYLKAKMIAKLVASASIYLGGLYYYYFIDLSERSWLSMWALPISFIMYNTYIWVFTNISKRRDRCKNL